MNMVNGDKANNGHSEQRTVVRVTALDNISKRREELAQLAGGKSATDAIAFADSLLTQAANHDEFAAFDTSMKKIAIALFRINGGKQVTISQIFWIKSITIAALSGRMFKSS